ncbi:MAG: ATP-grasp domain-containing protein [Bradymonadales bacterium]|nr:ATP-grasp domain-containing protein [Bradymonadales bacterium]
MFSKVLVANRGEIAVRILRTLSEMGIASVAVCSPADRGALHLRHADEVALLEGASTADSYLAIDRIVEAALQRGAQAIHPGYGFLSERARFASTVAEAGLTFIGPPAEVIARLGDKITARNLALSCGVPIIPGMTAVEPDLDRLADCATTVGYPILIKAAAGGGGKGMRVVRSPDLLASAAREASSEAAAAFGDGTIYLERFLDRPRHVEFQILADAHGHVIHLFERECSVQRRHQKLIEETPCIALNPDLRRRMGEAAVAVAQAAGYVNAGTVEFLVDPAGAFYFLEVNTRLQVEHPITEATIGLDLVRWQIEIAAGNPLPFSQQQICPRGHAIECRIYAEDPGKGFMPSPGRILAFRPASGPGVRFDSGIYEGCEVGVQYDPILGKLVVWAEDRPAALARMERALTENVVLGVHTTGGFLLEVIHTDAFREGRIHTGFIEEHFPCWQPAARLEQLALAGAAAEKVTPSNRAVGVQAASTEDQISPWHRLGAWDLGR